MGDWKQNNHPTSAPAGDSDDNKEENVLECPKKIMTFQDISWNDFAKIPAATQ